MNLQKIFVLHFCQKSSESVTFLEYRSCLKVVMENSVVNFEKLKIIYLVLEVTESGE